MILDIYYFIQCRIGHKQDCMLVNDYMVLVWLPTIFCFKSNVYLLILSRSRSQYAAFHYRELDSTSFTQICRQPFQHVGRTLTSCDILDLLWTVRSKTLCKWTKSILMALWDTIALYHLCTKRKTAKTADYSSNPIFFLSIIIYLFTRSFVTFMHGLHAPGAYSG